MEHFLWEIVHVMNSQKYLAKLGAFTTLCVDMGYVFFMRYSRTSRKRPPKMSSLGGRFREFTPYLRWFPSERTRHRFPMKLGMLLLQDKEI